MAKKEIKSNKKSATPKKVIKEVAETIIENAKTEEIEVNQEPMEELEEASKAKVDSVEQDPPMEVMDDKPTVVTETKEEEKEDTILEIQKEAFKAVFEKRNETRKISDPFNYSWNGQEIDY